MTCSCSDTTLKDHELENKRMNWKCNTFWVGIGNSITTITCLRNDKIVYAFIHRSLCGRVAFKNLAAVQRAAPSIPLLSANPRITPRQILSSNKGPLFAGGPHTWPESALLRNARNGTVCVSQRKLAAANYAPLHTAARRYNIKYESPQLYKAKRERSVPRDGG